KVVSTGVVGPGVLALHRLIPSGQPALIAHRNQGASAILEDHHWHVLAGKDARIARQPFGTAEICKRPLRGLHLVARDALFILRLLGDLGLQSALGVGEALLLCKQLRLERTGQLRVGFGDQVMELPFVFIAWVRERILHGLGELSPSAVLLLLPEKANVLIDVHDRAELPLELAELGPDLRGVTHGSPPWSLLAGALPQRPGGNALRFASRIGRFASVGT